MTRSNRASPIMSLVVLFACLSCSVSQAPEYPASMFRGNAEHTGVYDTQGVERLGGVLWRFTTAGPVRSTPVVTGDMVYVGSTDGNLYALDRSTGAERWHASAGSPVSSSPAVVRGLVIFGSRDGVFRAVDARTGELRWSVETGPLIPWEWGFEGWDVYTSSPVVADTTVVFGAGDGLLYALNVVTGRELWRFQTEGRIRSTPAITDAVVFIGSTDGRIYAVDLDTGGEQWRYETDGAGMRSAELYVDRKSIISSPAVVDGTVYVGSRDGYLYALDQATGERRWRIDHDGSWAMSSPAVIGNTLYSGTSDGRFVHAVDVATGQERWRFHGDGYTWSSPCIVDGTVYAGDGAGYLRAIDRHSGVERWNYWVGGGVYSSPVVADGVVIFGDENGTVSALHTALPGQAPFPLRAVFWDEDLRDLTIFRSHLETRIYFEQQGYRVLDSDALADFMRSRIDDGTPSVVVFAMDHVPTSVAAEPSDTVLFRRYLDAGGKVVWLGLPPMMLARNHGGEVVAVDRGRPTMLLGVDHASVNYDFYGSASTELGHRWGLLRGWVSSYSVEASDGIEVLGIDENGLAGAWVKNFGGTAGTGFVSMGSSRISLENMAAIRSVAEYGIVGHAKLTN